MNSTISEGACGPGFNAVCVVKEQQNYKSDPPSHGTEGRRKAERGVENGKRRRRKASVIRWD